MATFLAQLLASEKAAIVETIFTRIRNADAEHYQGEDARLVHARIERLAEQFIGACAGDPRDFSQYVRQITAERIREGYHLREIQRVLSMLEFKGWDICAHRIDDRGDLLRSLSLLTETIGIAKDELARVYLEESTKARDSVAILERRIERLMAGTV